MFNYMLDLELHFSNSVSFVPMLFDAKTMGVCKKSYLCSWLLCWHGNERLCASFNHLFRLGDIINVGDVAWAQS